MQTLLLERIYEQRINCIPKSQQRHRSVRRGTFTMMYDPSAADKKEFLKLIVNSLPTDAFDEPLYVELEFIKPRPKSHYNKKGLTKKAPYFAIDKPDVDNFIKFIFDCMNKHIWCDDTRIVRIIADKRYINEGEEPGVNIVVYRVLRNNP